MLTSKLRGAVEACTRPVAAVLGRLGLTPNAITVIGTVGTVLSAAVLYPLQHYFWGTLAVTIFVLFDMLDGTLARLRGTTSRWGAFLDSTLDRVADGAVFGSLAAAAFLTDRPVTGGLALFALVFAFTVSYTRARGEAVGGDGSGGLMERTERLVVVLVAAGCVGLGAPYSLLTIALALVAAGALVTVFQRMRSVFLSVKSEDAL
ncbi:CDP-alcohol phosphatidyltransferase [Brevibacterium ravenspurgense]|uniref:Phosphatidylinositol phosphate synthase n=1 Tax=Brevibacterium ravenspurgense TaxID=479117 RepID=A0A2I1IF27_9MICO|nr:CDP-alcohol phosphatidyltransferase family protein [Brevibacterium ravenspurgense]PKY69728.1 CDP-alcohol phosphatidyltransferase [Brevibacterium ravenspurgense]